ncbi:MAG TPA: hypothetical protein VGL90_01010 [Casimicrobiaceae bacterium]
MIAPVRPGGAGATRQCPHCRETILESAARCPSCRHYLRYDDRSDTAVAPAITPLRIEGSIRQPEDGDPWEYTVVVTVQNDRGEEIARKLVGVGAMDANEQCTVTLSVEAVAAPKRAGKRGMRH